jgi:hypothetical protein
MVIFVQDEGTYFSHKYEKFIFVQDEGAYLSRKYDMCIYAQNEGLFRFFMLWLHMFHTNMTCAYLRKMRALYIFAQDEGTYVSHKYDMCIFAQNKGTYVSHKYDMCIFAQNEGTYVSHKYDMCIFAQNEGTMFHTNMTFAYLRKMRAFYIF